jgi:hypothetical protein
MKYLAIFAIMFGLVSCETTGNKRQNGTNTEHVNAKLKGVNIYGTLTIGGGKQDTRHAEQEGLGKVKAAASVEDSVNGQEDAIQAILAPVPPVIVNELDKPAKPLELAD